MQRQGFSCFNFIYMHCIVCDFIPQILLRRIRAYHLLKQSWDLLLFIQIEITSKVNEFYLITERITWQQAFASDVKLLKYVQGI